MPLRLLLADDHAILHQSLKAVLERAGWQIVGQASNGHEAVKLARELRPDVAVLDVTMPLCNGLEAARQILAVSPRTRSILLTVHTEDQYVLEALRAGIKGYVVKTQAVDDLVKAIQEVSNGGTYLGSGASGTVVKAYLSGSPLPPEPLSSRERQVLQLVAEGKTTKEIAQVLGVSVKTAEFHRGRIMEKLDIHTTAGLVRDAIRRGLIES